ncbi:venom carboxylesterase-6 [Folsomia candida]|uniref:venom carboxylesterase-6 n=1 Tax=Folsomia candida TaxID=158441 RepID=UPI0016052876|nr:venom carboxylesterase-6 [Folsomia candida]
MVLFFGLFLVNTLCAVVPCQRVYDPPVPVPKKNGESEKNVNPVVTKFTFPITQNYGGGEEDLIIQTDAGLVQGFHMKTIRNRDIAAFTAIPYAEPPINDLRYRAPLPKKPWDGILQTNQIANKCMQVDGMQLLRIIGHEDCLYANVYTPQLSSTRRAKKIAGLPVLVFIHGGSFAFSSGGSFGPAYLLDRDVILVTFNYRLSSFGFLSTGDKTAPGNWGLKDQNLLLQWVKINIHAFGGDPSKVTIFGQSAGAVSVHLHMLSKQSQGLFRSGISQSGNAFCFWGVRDSSVDYTFRLANALKCPINESNAMVDCLRKLDPFLILYAEANLPDYKVFPGVFFGPIVEPKNDHAFLEERPEVLYAQNKVPNIPWINGFLADEGNGVGFLAWLYPLVMTELDQQWATLGPKILDLDFKGDLKHVSNVVSHIRQYYFGTKAIDFYSRKALTQMMGDRLIMSAIHKGLKYHARIAPTFGYFFNYTGRYGTAAIYGLNNHEWGISHDDDLIYLMNSTTYAPMKVGEPEYEISEFLTNVWASFATHGEPTFETDHDHKEIHFWEPINSTNDTILVVLINGDMPKMIPYPFLDRVKFWEEMNLVSQSKVGPLTLMPKNEEKPNLIANLLKPKMKPHLPSRLQFPATQKPDRNEHLRFHPR